MRHKVNNIHLVGIAGTGMSGIAEVLLTLGYEVSGSDVTENASARRLMRRGARVYQGHRSENLSHADVVVVSSAIASDNPEVVSARARGIPVVPRAEMLAELMRFKRGVAVAGSHGKTTTTSLVAAVLARGGLDPTYVIGGQLRSVDGHGALGQGDYLVAEADESDASFLHLHPMISVVTNIDRDHMDTYQQDPQKLAAAFIEFIHHLPFYGVAVLCQDDPGVQAILPSLSKRVVRYGLSEGAEVRGENIRLEGLTTCFDVVVAINSHHERHAVRLNLVGEHNVRNALAAFTVGREVNIEPSLIAAALAEYHGVERRFQIFDQLPLPGGSYTLVDDYGHHPAELEATMKAARLAFPGRRLVLAFQPHRYTRTRDCFDDFVTVLSTADMLVLGEVYAAGEQPLVGHDSRALLSAMRSAGKTNALLVKDVGEMSAEILRLALPNDVVAVMGAGSISQVAQTLAQTGTPA